MTSRRGKAAAVAASIALLLVASLVLTGLILVYRPLPTIDGEYRLIGLKQRAEVLRDAYGVPHIYAQNVYDLFYLQGYVTAQDRLFQMDLYRRAGSGRLSEVLGEATLDADRQMRTYGFARVAARELEILRPETRAALEAYADGVNKFLEQRGESPPLEFVVLGYRPHLWTALDSIVVAKLQSYDAAGNYPLELLRADLAMRLGTDALATLLPDPSVRSASIDETAWAAVKPLLSTGTARPGEAALRNVLPLATWSGSNCWALAGSRTRSGKPILAGDTHLAVRNPSIWYEIGVEGAGYKMVGFSFAGVPGIVIGHNDRIAWSLTYAYSDTQDLFVERQDPNDPRRFEYRGAFETATFVRETIEVKGRAEPVVMDVAITRHGPIITPVLKGQTAQLALRWTALEPGHLLDFLYALNRARNWDEFRSAAADFSGAAVSACYADVDGHIGYQLVGQLPVRRGDGRLPMPGWTGEYDWTGMVPAGANPSVADPASGIIVNSNDRPTQDSGAAGYEGEWDPGFRATYLRQRLAVITNADLPEMGRLQTDFTSLPVARFRETILSATVTGEAATRAQGLIREWDGTLAADSAGAALYEGFLVHLAERTFKTRLGAELFVRYAREARPAFALYQLLAQADHPWFTETGAPGARGRDALVAFALEDAMRDLADRMGDDPAGWSWGRLHTLTFRHPLGIGPLGLLLNIGPLRRAGDDDSVNDGAYDFAEPYAQDTHASQRMIADLSDLDLSLSITPEGQSGQPGSKYWGDQTTLWNAGDYKPMRFSKDRLGKIDGMLVFRPR